MKTLNKLRTFGKVSLLAVALIVGGCSSDDDDNNGGGGSGGTGSFLKAKVDGQQFNASIQGASTVAATKTSTMVGTLIMVQGSSAEINSIVINLLGIDEVGTYTISSADDGNVLAYVGNGSTVSYDTSDCSGATGTVEITKLNDEMIEGKFSFVGKIDEDCAQTKNITEGSFRGVFMQTGQ